MPLGLSSDPELMKRVLMGGAAVVLVAGVIVFADLSPEALFAVLLLTTGVPILLMYIVMYGTVSELDEQREVASRDALSAKDASQAKSRFLANMSHEFRTPLNAIIGYSELVQEGVEEMDAAELRENLDNVVTSAHHLMRLINDVLDLSKIEAGKMELDLHAFDAREPIAQVLISTRTLIEARGNTLILEMGDLGVLHNDSTKLAQCVLNLVSNAAKFTDCGTITVRAWRDLDKTLRVEVEDTGVGIPPEQQEQIFKEFQQANTSTARHHGGTGLGLSLTRALTGLMQGEVTLESTYGQGSIFRLRIPDLRQTPTSDRNWAAMSRGEALSGK